MTWQEDKGSTGFSPSRTTISHLGSHPPASIFEDSSSEGTKGGTSTGSFSSSSAERVLSRVLRDSLGMERTASYPEVLPPTNTFGRMTPTLMEPGLSLEVNQSEEMSKRIGSKFGKLLSLVIWNRSIVTFVFNIIELSESSALTLRNQLEWSELVTCSGVELLLESRGALGKKPVWELILKTPELNGGMVTSIMKMLSSMNFEVQSTSLICSGGSTDILSWWKSKERLFPCVPGRSGSPVI